MKKLTPVPDLVPTTDWETGMHQGSTGTEVGANSFFTHQPVAYVSVKHDGQLEVGNTKFAQISSTLRPKQRGQKRGKLQEDIDTVGPDSDIIQGEGCRIQGTPRAIQKPRRDQEEQRDPLLLAGRMLGV